MVFTLRSPLTLSLSRQPVFGTRVREVLDWIRPEDTFRAVQPRTGILRIQASLVQRLASLGDSNVTTAIGADVLDSN